jgi:small-conductance mechanosensitive channel
MEFLQTQIASNSLQSWLIAAVVAVVVLLLAGIFRLILIKQLIRLEKGNEVPLWPILLAVVRRTKWLFLFIFALFIGLLFIEIPTSSRRIINSIVIVSLVIQIGLWAAIALKVMIEQYRQKQLEKDPASITTLNLLNFIGRITIWSIVLLLVLDNLGFNITTLVAGLGVGGIAVALAMQTILGDLFASLSIVLDKPFVVGDFLVVGDLLGSVEYVGLKTTRLRSLSGEQLIFSNSDLLKSRIRNFGRMYERRVQFDIGVTYQTPREKLIKIPEIIRQAVEKQDKTRFDRSHFKEYGDFALIFESVYYVIGADYNLYMDIQQAINLHVHERFEQEGIEFAYPTQTLFIQKP